MASASGKEPLVVNLAPTIDDYSEKYPFDSVVPLYKQLEAKLDILAKHDAEVSGITQLMFDIQQETLNKMVVRHNETAAKYEDDIAKLTSEKFISESRITLLETKVGHLEKELETMKEYAMSNDIIFHGIREFHQENTEMQLRKFLDFELNLGYGRHVLIDDVHRLGKPYNSMYTNKPRPIICKFVRRLDKKYILSLGPRLADRPHFSMWEHVPPAAKEDRRELFDERKSRKDGGQRNVTVRGPRLLVDNITVKDLSKIKAKKSPSDESLNEAACEILTTVKNITVHETEVDGSKFKSLFLPLEDASQVTPALIAMRAHARTNSATHNIWAVCIRGTKKHFDDNEHTAGYRLRSVLERSEKQGVLLVARYYGGKDIGEKRFTAICDIGSTALQA